MSVDRTDHVLSLIDGATSDWETSADAMRWAPEAPSRLEQPRVGDTCPIHNLAGVEIGMGAVAEVRDGRPALAFHFDFDAFRASMTRGLRAAREVSERLTPVDGPALDVGDRIVIDCSALDGSDPRSYVVMDVRPDGSASVERVGAEGP